MNEWTSRGNVHGALVIAPTSAGFSFLPVCGLSAWSKKIEGYLELQQEENKVVSFNEFYRFA